MHGLMEMTTNMACEAALGSSAWECAVPSLVFPYVSSRAFLLEAAYDTLQVIHGLGLTCVTRGSDLAACSTSEVAMVDALGNET